MDEQTKREWIGESVEEQAERAARVKAHRQELLTRAGLAQAKPVSYRPARRGATFSEMVLLASLAFTAGGMLALAVL